MHIKQVYVEGSELKFAEGVGGVGGFDVASCLPGGEELAGIGVHASAQTELDEVLAGEELGEFYEQVAGASADADDVVLLAGCEEVIAEELALDFDVVEVAPSHKGLNLSCPRALGDVEGHGAACGADECSLVEVEQQDVLGEGGVAQGFLVELANEPQALGAFDVAVGSVEVADGGVELGVEFLVVAAELGCAGIGVAVDGGEGESGECAIGECATQVAAGCAGGGADVHVHPQLCLAADAGRADALGAPFTMVVGSTQQGGGAAVAAAGEAIEELNLVAADVEVLALCTLHQVEEGG